MHCNDFTVGWICDDVHELDTSAAMLDQEYRDVKGQHLNDTQRYRWGSIAGQKIVMACLVDDAGGKRSSLTVATHMIRSHPSIRFGFSVGTGTGIPTDGNDLRLGDVVVSVASGNIVKYDLRKKLVGELLQTNSRPVEASAILRQMLHQVGDLHNGKGPRIASHIHDMFVRQPNMHSAHAFPGREQDLLYDGECAHDSDSRCSDCGTYKEVRRPPRLDAYGKADHEPRIHYGLTASGDAIITNAETRDWLLCHAKPLCCEVSIGGLMERFPFLAVRGIEDYADSYHRPNWSGYAFATAAAYVLEILSVLTAKDVEDAKSLIESTGRSPASAWCTKRCF